VYQADTQAYKRAVLIRTEQNIATIISTTGHTSGNTIIETSTSGNTHLTSPDNFVIWQGRKTLKMLSKTACRDLKMCLYVCNSYQKNVIMLS
jgi:hypothetical protein